MKEHANGFDRFNQPWETPEAHFRHFKDIVESLPFVWFEYTGHKEDGSKATLTSYCGVVHQTELEHVATARSHALLAGMIEVLPVLAVPMTPTENNPQSRVFVQLAYADVVVPDGAPPPPGWEPPF
ncbi:hypothetical protein ABZ769_10995 [Streptomyces olivoreticuli]